MAKCIRIYNNGDFKESEHFGADLIDWIDYNKKYRWGTALVVDGVVEANGYLSDADIKQHLKRINNN